MRCLVKVFQLKLHSWLALEKLRWTILDFVGISRKRWLQLLRYWVHEVRMEKRLCVPGYPFIQVKKFTKLTRISFWNNFLKKAKVIYALVL